MAKFVRFPTGLVFDVENIAYILRTDLNKFAVVPKQTVSPNIPVLDGNELDALLAVLQPTLLDVKVPEVAPKLTISK